MSDFFSLPGGKKNPFLLERTENFLDGNRGAIFQPDLLLMLGEREREREGKKDREREGKERKRKIRYPKRENLLAPEKE